MISSAPVLDTIRAEARNAPTSGIVDIMTYARGREGLIPLFVGEGDLPTPAFITDRARSALSGGETFYTYQRGIPELREAIARYHERVYGGSFDVDRFTVTVGGMHATQMALRMVAGTGDEVLIPSPSWPNFDGVTRVTGAVPVAVPLDIGSAGWRLELERLAAAITPRTRAMLINSPANPTGWTATREDLAGILDLARRHGLWIVADEIYGRFVHDPALVAAGRSPSFRDVMSEGDRVMFVQTFSKNWAMTGWRVGWLETPPELGHVVENLVQYSTSGVPQFLQRGAVAALEDGEALLADQIERARRGRSIICDGLTATNVVDLPPPPAAFYAFFRVLGRPDTHELARELVDEAGICVAPGSAFGKGGGAHLRLCFLRDPAQLEEAVERLAHVLPRLARGEVS